MADEPTAKRIQVSDLVPDARNANKGTERGLAMLEDSLRRYGVGRGIVVDKHGRIIGGNKTVERLVDLGITDAVVVETSGDTLVVTQRTDLDLDSDPAARALAYADNRVAQIDLDFDVDVLLADLARDDLDLSGLWREDEIAALVALTEPPSLDDLEDKYGDPDDADFWPVVRVQIAPDVYELYQKLIARYDSKEEAEKFTAFIRAAHELLFSDESA